MRRGERTRRRDASRSVTSRGAARDIEKQNPSRAPVSSGRVRPPRSSETRNADPNKWPPIPPRREKKKSRKSRARWDRGETNPAATVCEPGRRRADRRAADLEPRPGFGRGSAGELTPERRVRDARDRGKRAGMPARARARRRARAARCALRAGDRDGRFARPGAPRTGYAPVPW